MLFQNFNETQSRQSGDNYPHWGQTILENYYRMISVTIWIEFCRQNSRTTSESDVCHGSGRCLYTSVFDGRYDVVWNVIAWNGVEYHCIVWFVVVWYGMVWYGTVRGDTLLSVVVGYRSMFSDDIVCYMKWLCTTLAILYYGMVGIVWYVLLWYSMLFDVMIYSTLVLCSVNWHCMIICIELLDKWCCFRMTVVMV